MRFVEVILPLALPRTFTYKAGDAELQPGTRVAVPFGRTRIYTALVIETHDNAPTLYEARDIEQVLDTHPIVTDIQIAHWFWIASYYMCTIGEVYRSAMPSGLLLESETLLSAAPDTDSDLSLSPDEQAIQAALTRQSSLSVREVSALLNKKRVFPVLQGMLAKNLVRLREEIQDAYKPKLVRYIRLAEAFDDPENLQPLLEELKNAPKQRDLVLSYFQLKARDRKPIAVNLLLEHAAGSAVALKSLVEKGIFESYQLQQDRQVFDGSVREDRLELSVAQQEAFEAIRVSFQSHDVTLLHGVTASGKTEIYVQLIERFLEEDRSVLYLLPEIALTTQLVERLRWHFGEKVTVFHSGFSNNERVEAWQRVLEGSPKARIIIGARSALFLPFRHLGFIIVDEEHEPTFKQQDPAPRYHARDTAIVLAGYHGAKVLLGSATPSLETRFNAESGKYGLVALTKRYGDAVLPEIALVDLKDAYFRKKMKGHFSDTLIENLQETLERGEQAILFQNRRGFSPVVECLDCGHVPQCPQCDVSLTYHKHKSQLRCHYCGHAIAMPQFCHACSSVNLTTKGFGTEQVQEELEALFPAIRSLRMDQDTTRGKHAFSRIIDAFRNREADILIGTQMLSKGLDFDNVGLVGIMNADNMLYYPDFRAQERAFQMLTQVAGRAGRSERKGKVIIQTYNPYHNIIRQVMENDYPAMYHEQLHERRIYKYPPFFRLIRITLRYREYERLREASAWLADVLRQHLDMPILGPEEPPIARIRNEYIRQILVKIPGSSNPAPVKSRIDRIRTSFSAVPHYRSVRVVVNVDFY
ncbi:MULTISPECIES: primosomal protein N' [unclassified Flavobacterium]|uniref:replication restart helicase PriA n=1 Tax=unclassified Flavobacterium TaxID=196869 RepID=UPI001F12DAB2|nr:MULTISPECIES: primosomal protein N' [unclassified Flavobacterium]UMY64394.1 primosomal protein N' [Flavobacterium sp. HJ-32-4]